MNKRNRQRKKRKPRGPVTTRSLEEHSVEIQQHVDNGIYDVLKQKVSEISPEVIALQRSQMMFAAQMGWSLGILDACLECGSTEDSFDGRYAQLGVLIPDLKLYAMVQVCVPCLDEIQIPDIAARESYYINRLIEQARSDIDQPERWASFIDQAKGTDTENDFLTRPGGHLENIAKARDRLGGGRFVG